MERWRERPSEHRRALIEGQRLGKWSARLPEDPRRALRRGIEELREERKRLNDALAVHRRTLEAVQEQLSEDRAFYRRAYAENRWWIELALKWWENHRAA